MQKIPAIESSARKPLRSASRCSSLPAMQPWLARTLVPRTGASSSSSTTRRQRLRTAGLAGREAGQTSPTRSPGCRAGGLTGLATSRRLRCRGAFFNLEPHTSIRRLQRGHHAERDGELVVAVSDAHSVDDGNAQRSQPFSDDRLHAVAERQGVAPAFAGLALHALAYEDAGGVGELAGDEELGEHAVDVVRLLLHVLEKDQATPGLDLVRRPH